MQDLQVLSDGGIWLTLSLPHKKNHGFSLAKNMPLASKMKEEFSYNLE